MTLDEFRSKTADLPGDTTLVTDSHYTYFSSILGINIPDGEFSIDWYTGKKSRVIVLDVCSKGEEPELNIGW